MPRELRGVVLFVSDVADAVAFYESVLGLDREGPARAGRDPGDAALFWMDAGDGSRLGLVHDPAGTPGSDRDIADALDTSDRVGGPAPTGGAVFLSVSEAELAAIVRRLHSRDRRYSETQTTAHVLDPDGNLVGVTTRRE
jgi:catechol 2,3-dioxygenase-like lactoylglutathione lyase family enzyme